jgi:hypothetical protein
MQRGSSPLFSQNDYALHIGAARPMLRTRPVTYSAPQHSELFVRKVRRMGRGVFASRAFRKAELIEVCPVILLPGITDEDQLGGMKKYVFQWQEAGVNATTDLSANLHGRACSSPSAR